MKGNPTIEELEDVLRRYPVDPGQVRALLARVPPSWSLIERSADGAAFRRGSTQVIVTLALYDDHELWIHVSACGRTGAARFTLPSWEDLKRVKHDFIGDRWAYQVLPPMSEYVNQHPCVLHLFARFDDAKPALPDFTRGLGVL